MAIDFTKRPAPPPTLNLLMELEGHLSPSQVALLHGFLAVLIEAHADGGDPMRCLICSEDIHLPGCPGNPPAPLPIDLSIAKYVEWVRDLVTQHGEGRILVTIPTSQLRLGVPMGKGTEWDEVRRVLIGEGWLITVQPGTITFKMPLVWTVKLHGHQRGTIKLDPGASLDDVEAAARDMLAGDLPEHTRRTIDVARRVIDFQT